MKLGGVTVKYLLVLIKMVKQGGVDVFIHENVKAFPQEVLERLLGCHLKASNQTEIYMNIDIDVFLLLRYCNYKAAFLQ